MLTTTQPVFRMEGPKISSADRGGNAAQWVTDQGAMGLVSFLSLAALQEGLKIPTAEPC